MKKALIHTETGVIFRLMEADPDDDIIEPDGFRIVDIPQDYAFQRPRVDKLVNGQVSEATTDEIDRSGIDHPRKWARVATRQARLDAALKKIAEAGATKVNMDEYFQALYDLDYGI